VSRSRPYASALERAIKAEAELADLRDEVERKSAAEGKVAFAGMMWATGSGPMPRGVNDPRDNAVKTEEKP
jgi:hypothetical protein